MRKNKACNLAGFCYSSGMKTTLPWRKTKEIEGILKDEFSFTPARRAAKRLLDHGFTADDLWLFNKTAAAQPLPDEWKQNTYNELRDHAILGKFAVKL